MDKEVQAWIDDPFIPSAWATMMFFRTFGFSVDDVYLRYSKSDVFVGLHGEKYPNGADIRIGTHPHLEDFISIWPYVLEAYREGKIPDELIQEAWHYSAPVQSPELALSVIQNMIALGIVIPAFDPDVAEDGTLTPAAMRELLEDPKWN